MCGQQESIPVGCILPAFLVLVLGDLLNPPIDADTSGCDLPGGRPPRCRPPWRQILMEASHVTCEGDACWEANPARPLWTE